MLKWRDIEKTHSEITWTIGSPVPGVVIIDVTVGSERVPVPLHWRAGTWRKPPLDIILDDRGRLVAMQFVLQDERMEIRDGTRHVEPEIGVPRFDVSSWATDRYRDEQVPVVALRAVTGELVIRIGDEQPLSRACEPSPGLVLAFGDDDGLARIEIGPLTNDDWASIDTFSVGT